MLKFGMLLGLLHQLTDPSQALLGRVRFDEVHIYPYALGGRDLRGLNHIQIIRFYPSESDIKIIVTIEQLAQFIKQLLDPYLQP
ncbi:hypothetical protein D3C85_1610780 [compost metagenome]